MALLRGSTAAWQPNIGWQLCGSRVVREQRVLRARRTFVYAGWWQWTLAESRQGYVRGVAPSRETSKLQQADDADEEVDATNLLTVTPVPTHEEMLAWAKETDKRIAAGELPPFSAGSAGPTRGNTSSLLSDQEQMQLDTVSKLLSKRREKGSYLSEEEKTALRSAIEGVSASVAGNDDSFFGESVSDAESGGGVGTGVDGGHGAAESELVHNPIYGSREVRDKVYLYAWSLVKNKQEEAERRYR